MGSFCSSRLLSAWFLISWFNFDQGSIEISLRCWCKIHDRGFTIRGQVSLIGGQWRVRWRGSHISSGVRDYAPRDNKSFDLSPLSNLPSEGSDFRVTERFFPETLRARADSRPILSYSRSNGRKPYCKTAAGAAYFSTLADGCFSITRASQRNSSRIPLPEKLFLKIARCTPS